VIWSPLSQEPRTTTIINRKNLTTHKLSRLFNLISELAKPITAKSWQEALNNSRGEIRNKKAKAPLGYTMDGELPFLGVDRIFFPSRGDNLDYLGNHYGGQLMTRTRANTSIADERSIGCMQFLSKRFSIGFGNFPDPFSMIPSRFDEDVNDGVYAPGKPDKLIDNEFHRKKRRMSSLGFLSPSFFEEHAKVKENRRSSIASVATMNSLASLSHPFEKDDNDDYSDVSSIDSEVHNGFMFGQTGPVAPFQNKGFEKMKMKDIMIAFTEAMVKSQKSQQAIHDWDRKMGLKRSHSKTMRLTMRSRKKLRMMLRKELHALMVKT
jgi:hypothetical protein